MEYREWGKRLGLALRLNASDLLPAAARVIRGTQIIAIILALTAFWLRFGTAIRIGLRRGYLRRRGDPSWVTCKLPPDAPRARHPRRPDHTRTQTRTQHRSQIQKQTRPAEIQDPTIIATSASPPTPPASTAEEEPSDARDPRSADSQTKLLTPSTTRAGNAPRVDAAT